MAENTQNPPITSESIEQQLRSINSYIDSGLPQILSGMDAAEQNKGEQIARMKPFLPQPTAPTLAKLQTLVDGDSIIGPNRGAKQGALNTNFEYVKALSDNDKLKISQTADPFFYAKPTSFNGSHQAYNFDRYYAHPNFKKLGFSIYKDNEAVYNANSSWFDDFVRMGKKLPSLILNGAWSNLKNWSVTGLEADTESAAQMEYDLGIATSSKKGFGAWTTNLIGNFGYTIGVIGEMVLEDAALKAAAVATRNPVLLAASEGRRVSNLKSLSKAMSIMAKTLNNADKARTFRTAVMSGTKSFGKNFMPFQDLGEFAVDLMNPNSAISRLADGAKMAKGVGSFYRGMKEINAVTSESRLEGGFTQNDLIQKEYNAFVENKGREPNSKESEDMYNNAVKASTKTIIANVPAIFVSNRITLDLALNPYGKLARTFSSNTLKSPLFKVVKDASGKSIVEAKGLKAGFEKLKGITKVFNKDFYKGAPTKLSDNFGIKNIGRNVGGGIRYFKANLMEGLQETYQEGVQVAVEDYYMNKYYADLYSDPMIAANHGIAASIEKGMESQLSAQGLDVFASGFLMGGLATGAQNKIVQPFVFGTMRAKDYIYKTNEYKTYQDSEKERLQNFADAVNDIRARRGEYASWLDMNVKAQRDLQSEYEAWSEVGDEHEVENVKKDSMFMHVMTLLRYGRYNVFQDELDGLKDLTDDELSEAFGDEGADKSKTRERLDTAIKKASDVKKWYDKVNEKVVNPFKPAVFNKDDDPEGYSKEMMGYKAFETAKQALMFNEYSYQDAIERIEGMLSKASMNSPLGEAASSDFSVLYRLFDLQTRIGQDLPTEIDFLNGGDAAQKSKAKKKQTQLDNLTSLRDEMFEYTVTHALVERAASGSLEAKNQLREKANAAKSKVGVVSEPDPITGQISMEFDSEEISDDAFLMSYQKDSLWDAYAKYSKNIAELNNVFPILESLETSFEDFTGFLRLNNDAKRFASFLDILADPNSIYAMSDRIKGAMQKAGENSANLVTEAVAKFNTMTKNDEFLQDLIGIKVYFAPEEVDNFFKKGQMPKVFYDAGTGNAIKETDPRYAKIIDFIDKYEKLRGVTFSGKPVATPAATTPGTTPGAPVVSPAEELSGTEEEEKITDDTPFDKYPAKIKVELTAEYNKAIARAKKLDGIIPTIQEWLADSPMAKAIIQRGERRGTIIKKSITTQITKEAPKSIVGPTPALQGIYDAPFALKEGIGYVQVDADGKTVTDSEGQPIVARRATSIVKKEFDKAVEQLTRSQDRGNIIDEWLRAFSTPDPTSGISQKDVYLNLIADFNNKVQGAEAELADFIRVLKSTTNQIFLATQSKALGIQFSEGAGNDLVDSALELARVLADYTWYPQVPALAGMIEGKLTAGTPDLLVEKDGKFFIIDFKTSFKPRRTNDDLYSYGDKVQQNVYADNFESLTGNKISGLFILNILVKSTSDGKNISSIGLDKFSGVETDANNINVNKKESIFTSIPRESANSILGYEADEKPVVTDAEADIERKNTFTRLSMDDVSEGTASAKKGSKISNPDKVSSQLSIGDKVEFFAERKRTGVWDGKRIIEDGTNNPWGILGILSDTSGYIKNTTKINAELVAEYRAQEIAEFRKDVEDAESFIVNGRIDSKKVKASSNAKAKEIYDRYDGLITPLLPAAPVSDVEAKKADIKALIAEIEPKRKIAKTESKTEGFVYTLQSPGMVVTKNLFGKVEKVTGVLIDANIPNDERAVVFSILADSLGEYYGKVDDYYNAALKKLEEELAALEGKPTDSAGTQTELEFEELIIKVGDRVKVNTRKDGEGIVEEDLGDRVRLQDGRRPLKKNLTKLDTEVPVEESEVADKFKGKIIYTTPTNDSTKKLNNIPGLVYGNSVYTSVVFDAFTEEIIQKIQTIADDKTLKPDVIEAAQKILNFVKSGIRNDQVGDLNRALAVLSDSSNYKDARLGVVIRSIRQNAWKQTMSKAREIANSGKTVIFDNQDAARSPEIDIALIDANINADGMTTTGKSNVLKVEGQIPRAKVRIITDKGLVNVVKGSISEDYYISSDIKNFKSTLSTATRKTIDSMRIEFKNPALLSILESIFAEQGLTIEEARSLFAQKEAELKNKVDISDLAVDPNNPTIVTYISGEEMSTGVVILNDGMTVTIAKYSGNETFNDLLNNAEHTTFTAGSIPNVIVPFKTQAAVSVDISVKNQSDNIMNDAKDNVPSSADTLKKAIEANKDKSVSEVVNNFISNINCNK